MVPTLSAAPTHEVRFRAMGSDIHVLVTGGTRDHVDAARARIGELERRWSRFLPESELSRLNRAAGRPVRVSTDTLNAVAGAIEAWRATDGRFDPTVLHAMVAAGYDRDFARIDDDARAGPPVLGAGRTPGCGGITIDAIVRSVTLPAGVGLDLGGIGKGLAADLVVTELLDAGAVGACVNVGGDLRVSGPAPSQAGWVVEIEHVPELRLALAEGAVATSSSSKRRWIRAGSSFHHLLDPERGLPAETGLRAVTVVAGSAAAAETLTKAAFVAGVAPAPEIIADAGATGLLVTDTGTVIQLVGLDEYLR